MNTYAQCPEVLLSMSGLKRSEGGSNGDALIAVRDDEKEMASVVERSPATPQDGESQRCGMQPSLPESAYMRP
jgi:hypothetical protein